MSDPHGRIRATTGMNPTTEPLIPEEDTRQHPRLSVQDIANLIAYESALIIGCEDQFIEIESILTELHLLLNAAEAMKESNERVTTIVDTMQRLRSSAELAAGEFVYGRESQNNRGWFEKIIPFPRHGDAKPRLEARVGNLRQKLLKTKTDAASIGVRLVDASEKIQSAAQSLPLCGPSHKEYVKEGPNISGATEVVISIEGNPIHGIAGYLRRCLFYLELFSEDYDIPARRLINLWVAEGFVLRDNSGEPPEVIAEKYLSNLIEKNMIQVVEWKVNGRVKTCKVHDVCRDLWVKKERDTDIPQAQRIAQASSSSDTAKICRLADHLDPKDKSYSHIHEDDRPNNSKFRSDYENLHTLVSFDWREGTVPGKEIGDFLRRGIANGCFQGMRVLDLERVFRPNLPESLGKLIHLTYLGLRWTFLRNLPSSIFNLLNLLTLDLKHTYISTLPSSFWKMQQLRHLYVSESCRTRLVPSQGKSYLTDLQTLWGAFVDKESPLDNSLRSLTKLRKLGITCRLNSDQRRATAAWISKLRQLESLRLISIDSSGKHSELLLESLSGLLNLSKIYLLGRLINPITENTFPEKLTKLTLSFSGLMEAPMHTLGKLPNLKILCLLSDAYVGKFMLCPPDSFPSLQVLNLWKLKQLEGWTVGKNSLLSLRELEIRSCTALKTFPEGLQHLQWLNKLRLEEMPEEFKSRVREVKGKDWYEDHVTVDDQS